MAPATPKDSRRDVERLFFTVFPLAQKLNGLFVSRIRQQVKSADAFHRDNFSMTNRVGGGSQRLVAAKNRLAASVPIFQSRAAN